MISGKLLKKRKEKVDKKKRKKKQSPEEVRTNNRMVISPDFNQVCHIVTTNYGGGEGGSRLVSCVLNVCVCVLIYF